MLQRSQCVSRWFHRFLLTDLKCEALMFLHRGFFAQAMGEFPSDPLRSPVGRSFIVAYQCASALVTSTINQFKLQPVICSRMWRIWSHAFSAAVREFMSCLAGCVDVICRGYRWHRRHPKTWHQTRPGPIGAFRKGVLVILRGSTDL